MSPIKSLVLTTISAITGKCIVNLFGKTYVVSRHLTRRLR